MRTQRCLAAIVILTFLVACSSPPDRVALSSLEAIKATADSYMRVVAGQYAYGRHYDIATKTWSVVDPSAVVISEDVKTKSIDAYDKFAATAKAAALALATVTTYEQGQAISSQVTDALNALLTALRSFGVKV